MLNFEDFINNVIEGIKKQLSNAYISRNIVAKNNDIFLTGITIRENSNMAPTIYINEYFRQYQAGRKLSEIINEIVCIYNDSRCELNYDVSSFLKFDRVKDKIIFSLINYKMNERRLKDIPYFQIMDLAIIFKVLVDAGNEEMATITIQKKHLEIWNTTKEELYAMANVNTPKLLGCDLKKMEHVLAELLEEDACLFNGMETSMYVLTNMRRQNGAGCILYKDILKNLSMQLGCDLYILPSSVHEVIILPANEDMLVDELNEMVREVNSSNLIYAEVLSDHVYLYSRKTDRLGY